MMLVASRRRLISVSWRFLQHLNAAAERSGDFLINTDESLSLSEYFDLVSVDEVKRVETPVDLRLLLLSPRSLNGSHLQRKTAFDQLTAR